MSTTRSFLIQVVQDQAPVVEVAVDVIRKVNNVYLVTPKARIPFNPDSFVKDDRGLSKVEFTYSYYPEDSDVVRGLRTKFALRPLLDLPLPGGTPSAAIALHHVDNFRFLDRAENRISGSVFVREFLNQQSKLTFVTRGEFEAQLPQPKTEDTAPPTIKKIELKDPSRDFIDLDVRYSEGHPKAGQRLFDILPKSIDDVQAIYRMDINVQATDTNVDADGGPKVTRNAEPIRLRIVSEGDLLLEISKEEELLAVRLDEALAKLAAAKKKYEFVRSSNGYKEETPEQVDSVKVRSQDAYGDVEKSRDIVQSVGREYRRLTRECEVNQLNEAALKRYRDYTALLESILSESPEVAITFPKTQGLMAGIQNTLNAGRWAPVSAVGDAENSLYNLERRLKEIRDMGIESRSIDKLRKDLVALKERQQRIEAEILEMKVRWEKDLLDPSPKIGDVGVVSLSKGEAKKVQHTIDWRKYEGPKGKEDELPIKITSSDPSVVVPGDMTLVFDRHQFRFEYEVKAGAKEGNYTVTVTPAAGKPVTVSITVK